VQEQPEATAPTDWQAVRAEYEANDISVVALAAKHSISATTIQRHAKDGGWIMRNVVRRVDRGAIIARMFRVLERQIIHLETQTQMTDTGEKEVAVLGKLATTLEKLIDIDTAAERSRPAQSKDMKALRNELAERIAQLKRG